MCSQSGIRALRKCAGKCPRRTRRQQGGGGVMLWAGIVGDELVSPVRVQEGVKLTSHTYCQFLKSVLEPCMAGRRPIVAFQKPDLHA